MKRILTVSSATLLGLGISLPAVAESPPTRTAETDQDAGAPVLLGRNVHVGGYGGLDVMYTRMFGRDGAVVGAQAALLLDHRLALGLAGYGFSNPLPGADNAEGERQRFETGYGGVTLRYSLLSPNLPVYLTVGGLVGAGGIKLEAADGESSRDDVDGDVFAVFQPDVTVHANLTRWMRVGITGGYRFTSGVSESGFDESDVDGVIVGGHLQFGRF